MGNKYMWEDVNTKPVQGAIFRIFRSEMMGVPVENDDDVERRRTHPLLILKTDTDRVLLTDDKIKILKSANRGSPTKVFEQKFNNYFTHFYFRLPKF